MLQCFLITYICRGTTDISQILFSVEQPSQVKIVQEFSRAVVSRLDSQQMVQAEQEKCLLLPIEISSLEYKLETKSNVESVLSAQPSQPTPLSLTVTNSNPQSWIRERTLYRVYTRELNKKLCIGLSTLYTNSYGPYKLFLAYPK